MSKHVTWAPAPGTLDFPRWPHYADDEISAVNRVLTSGKVNYWTGDEVRQFEVEWAQYVGTRYAVALANGTVALELALRAYGIGEGAEVITSPRTFIASASCAVMCGARPVFADVSRDSQNITAETIARVLTGRTRAIIPVHLAGWPCEMDEINALAREHDLVVIEDCAQATGAYYRGRAVGSLAHAGAFSFCQDKIITTGGEGGLLTLDDESVWLKAWSFKDHGKDFSAANRPYTPGFRWVHHSFGTNWRMTEMQAAIGRVQLRKLDDWVARRATNAHALASGLADIEALRIPMPPEHVRHAFYKFYAFVRPEMLRRGWNRDRIAAEITVRGVPCSAGSCSEVYRERAFEAAGMQPISALPVARELGETSLMFLVHPTLGPEHMNLVCEVVHDVFRKAVR